MTAKAKEVLWIIAKEAAKTSDGYVMSAQIPVKDGEEAREIKDELVKYGCISHAHVFGRYCIQCKLEVKAFDYLNE